MMVEDYKIEIIKKVYIAMLTIMLFLSILCVVCFIAYIQQEAINKENAKFSRSWCDVDFGSSKATIECSNVSRLAQNETND